MHGSKSVRCCYHDVGCDFNLEPKHIGFIAVMLYPTLIRLRPPSGSSRLFPWWVSQLWSENCASTLVTPVSFSSWPWLMYCSHYMLVQPGCSLCSALKLCHCLSFFLWLLPRCELRACRWSARLPVGLWPQESKGSPLSAASLLW